MSPYDIFNFLVMVLFFGTVGYIIFDRFGLINYFKRENK